MRAARRVQRLPLHAAKQRRRADRQGPPQRRQRKRQRGQHAEHQGQQRGRPQAVQQQRHRQLVRRQLRAGQRQAHAQQRARCAGQHSQQPDLQQHKRGQPPVAQTQRAQRGQAGELALQVGLHAVEHAQPANEQRRKTDQQQARADLAQHLGHAVAALVEAARLGVQRGEGGDEAVAPCVGRLGGAHAVMVFHPAERLHQARGHERALGHQHRRCAPVGAQAAVGLAHGQRAHGQRQVADLDAITGLQAQACGERGIDRRAPLAVPLREGVGQRAGRLQRHCAVERVGGVGAQQLDQLCAAALQTQHGAQLDHARDGAARLHPGQRIGRQRLGRFDLHVATEDQPRVVAQRVGHLAVQAAARRHERHAQHQAGDEDPQAPAAGAQVAPGQVKQKGHRSPPAGGWSGLRAPPAFRAIAPSCG